MRAQQFRFLIKMKNPGLGARWNSKTHLQNNFSIYEPVWPLFRIKKVSSLGRYVFGSEISYNKPPPPACLG